MATVGVKGLKKKRDLVRANRPARTWNYCALSCLDCQVRRSIDDCSWRHQLPACQPSRRTHRGRHRSVDCCETSACVGTSHVGTTWSRRAADRRWASESTDSPTRCSSPSLQQRIKRISTYTTSYIHRESKKGRHYTLVHIFAKYWPIFTILSPTDSVETVQ